MDNASLGFLAGKTAPAKTNGLVIEAYFFYLVSARFRSLGKMLRQSIGVSAFSRTGGYNKNFFAFSLMESSFLVSFKIYDGLTTAP